MKELINNIKSDQYEQDDEEKEDKNKGNQLDGVLRDVLSWWENVNYQNSLKSN